MPTLTDALARSAAPNPGKAETVLWDEKTTGFGLRIRASGGRSWIWVRRGADGRVERYTIGAAASTKATVARDVAEKRNAEREAVRHGYKAERIDRSAKRRAPPPGPTIRELAPAWFEELKLNDVRASTLSEYRRYILKATGELGDKPAELVTRSDLNALIVGLQAKGKPAAARACRSALSSMFTWLTTTGRLGDRSSPLHGSYKPKEKGKRKRYLSAAELRAVWRAADKLPGGVGYGTIIKLLMLTGQRRDEIGGLTNEEVWIDARHPQIALPEWRTKNKLSHLVPLVPESIELIEPWLQAAESGPLFGRGPNGYAGWSKAIKRFRPLVEAEFGKPLKHWTPHDFRRSFITHTREQRLETDTEVIELFVNHVSGTSRAGVAGVYNCAELIEPRRELAQRYATWVMSIVS